MKKKILIVGASGMLGARVLEKTLEKDCYEVSTLTRRKIEELNVKQYYCDFMKAEAIQSILAEINPDIIVNCAAKVSVDYCEKEKTDAYHINAVVPKILAMYRPNQTLMIQISTDSIFDGSKGNYSEIDEPHPINQYAYGKLQGEKFVQNNNQNSIIVRTNIYGLHDELKGDSIAEWAIKQFENNLEISGFEDVYFNPLYTEQLAQIIHQLIDKQYRGIINVGSKECVSKYEFLKEMAKIFGFDEKLVKKSSIDKHNFNAERPKNTYLNTQKMEDFLGHSFGLKIGIKDMHKVYVKYKGK